MKASFKYNKKQQYSNTNSAFDSQNQPNNHARIDKPNKQHTEFIS